MHIENSSHSDLSTIFEIYDAATLYMKSKNQVAWPLFDKKMILKEIEAQQQWKLVIDHQIACIWMTADNDPLIWDAHPNDKALYLHRIAVHPSFRGQGLLQEIFNWAHQNACNNGAKYLRMDTVGENKNLIEHYRSYGFKWLGMKNLTKEKGLPLHYREGEVCLFEKTVLD